MLGGDVHCTSHTGTNPHKMQRMMEGGVIQFQKLIRNIFK